MIGLIHKLLFETIRQVCGPDAVSELKKRVGIEADKTFRMGIAYPDTEWQALYKVALEMTGLSEQELMRVFARHFMNDACMRWPTWFAMAKTARDMIKLQPMIHNSFASGLVDPIQRQGVKDKFKIEESDAGLIVHYRSPNGLCLLYSNLAEEVARFYGETIIISQVLCTKLGDNHCEFHIQFIQESEEDVGSP